MRGPSHFSLMLLPCCIASKRRVVLKGTAEQIGLAQSLIEEKVAEDDDLRQKVELSAASRSPRREHKDNLLYLMAPTNEQVCALLICMYLHTYQ